MARLVTLYSRAGCHLCEDVREDLRLLEGEQDIAVQEIDITSDQALLSRFQYLIPVVDVEGGPLLTAPITIRQLREAIEK